MNQIRTSEKSSIVYFVDAINASAQYNFCLLRILSSAGINVHFFTSKFAWETFPLPPNTHIHFFRFSTWLCETLSLPRLIRQILRAVEYPLNLIQLALKVRKNKIRTLHLNWCRLPMLDIVLIRFLKNRGVSIILTAHNFVPHDTGDRYKKADVNLYRQADKIVVLTNFVKELILKNAEIDEGNIVVIPHPDFSEIVSAAGYDKSALWEMTRKKRIFFFGAILPYKGLDLLIRAFSAISADFPEYRLCIMGNAYGRFEKYEKLIQDNGIADKTDYHPDFISTKELIREINTSEIVVLPYRRSSQSGVIPFANTLGIPVIATAVGGIPEMIIEGENGYLVKEVDADKLSRIMKFVLEKNRGKNPQTARVLSSSERLFSSEMISAALKKLYEN